MPELPEAEASRRLLETNCVSLKVTKCIAIEGGGGPRDGQFDDLVMDEGQTAQSISHALLGRTVKEVHRKGKQIWIDFSGRGPSLLFHHGMTGHLYLKGIESVSYARDTSKVDQWPPKFTKLQLEFGGNDGIKLSFSDPRRLGRVRLRKLPREMAPICNLACDPVTDSIDPKALHEILMGVSAPIKAVLLDQQRVVAGIGNWLADDILLEARIHPETPPSAMSFEDFSNLASAIEHICREACRVNANSKLFPSHWLFHMRWKAPRGQTKLSDGRTVIQSTVAGRSTIHVPAIQHKRSCRRKTKTNTSKVKVVLGKVMKAVAKNPLKRLARNRPERQTTNSKTDHKNCEINNKAKLRRVKTALKPRGECFEKDLSHSSRRKSSRIMIRTKVSTC